MPMFGFHCRECGITFEEWVQRVSDVDHVRCPHCSSEHVRKLLSKIAPISFTISDPGSSNRCSTSGI